MPRRMSVLLVASWLVVPGLAVAEDLPPEKLAAIRRDEQAAQARVNAAYGNRKPSELSNEERRQLIQEHQSAGQEVLKKHGVSDKEYSRQVARMGKEEREAVAQAEKKLDADEKAAREAAATKTQEAQEPEEIPIHLGMNDDNPVELESTQEAASTVEQGLPPGEQGLEAPAGPAGGTEITPEATFEIPVK
ncbi:MAG: hypothetical protein JXB05_20315 [Myxococcaceae bacterium]|nr:hypothetical protein [Myxococcaceae bacterium]